jgi:hypothetical protein
MSAPADGSCDAGQSCPDAQESTCQVTKNNVDLQEPASNGATAPAGIVDRRMRLSEAVQRCTVHWFNTALLEAQVRRQLHVMYYFFMLTRAALNLAGVKDLIANLGRLE